MERQTDEYRQTRMFYSIYWRTALLGSGLHDCNCLWMAAWVNVERSSFVLPLKKKRWTLIITPSTRDKPSCKPKNVLFQVLANNGIKFLTDVCSGLCTNLLQSCMASAAAVPSSSNEALATAIPVMSQTMV